MEPEYLTEKEVSVMTGIPVSTLRNHRHKRTGLPYIKFGAMVRYKREDVQNYLDNRRTEFSRQPKKTGKRPQTAKNRQKTTPTANEEEKPKPQQNIPQGECRMTLQKVNPSLYRMVPRQSSEPGAGPRT